MKPTPLLPAGEETSRGSVPVWAITFADLMTLLMSFFILLYSFSSLEAEKFRAVAGSLREAFGAGDKSVGTQGAAGTAAGGDSAPPGGVSAEEMRLIEKLRSAVERAGLGAQGSARATGRGVSLRLDGETVFDSGSAELKSQALPLLERIAAIAAENGGTIEVEGHTDDVPIANDRYPSNWELSGARAGNVVRQLAAMGIPATRLRAVGYADSRPLGSNATEQGRAANRRVEFVFVGFDETGPSGDPKGPTPLTSPGAAGG